MLDDSHFSTEPDQPSVFKRMTPYVAAIVIAGAGVGYAVHERGAAQSLTAQNTQMNAQLSAASGQLAATNSELNALSAKVDAMAAKPSPVAPVAGSAAGAVHSHHVFVQDKRFDKMQSQLDAQGKEIDDARNDLTSTRTELTGSIAHTHDELVLLEKRGARSYFEFDLDKSKEYQREGPISISLRKANTKKSYADLQLIVDDRTMQQKHVNLYQPAMFYEPDSPQPVEIVINDISKDHIHGYISSPKYRRSELTAMANGNPAVPDQNPVGQEQAVSNPPQLSTRHKLSVPSDDPNQ